MKKQVTYHIIGGGVAGLSCAKYIKKFDKNSRTIVYEASDRIGGRAYSYDDASLGCRLDNATHIILGANKNIKKVVNDKNWTKNCSFWNAKDNTISNKSKNFKDEMLKGMCNTKAVDIAKAIYKKIWFNLFPFTSNKTKLFFFEHNISQILINPFLAFVDELNTNCKLMKIETQFAQIAQLVFNNKMVEIGAGDKIICALDAKNKKRVFGGETFDFNSVINIFYKTSTEITLPSNAKLMGITGGIADWVFVSGDILGVTISDANDLIPQLDSLARDAWVEVCNLRGVGSAFVPPFRITCTKNATICQDEVNNNKRPLNANTEYENLFIAGDWTLKDYPCCLEGACLSARRAAKAATKKDEE